MGDDWEEVKKRIFKHGHERLDVIQYRRRVFLTRLKNLQHRKPYPLKNNRDEVVNIKLLTLSLNERMCIPITDDECTCNSNDGPHHQQIQGDEPPIQKKSRGLGLNISAFIILWGCLTVGPDVTDDTLFQLGLHKREATEITQCGEDIYWNQDHIVQQTLMAIFNIANAYKNKQCIV